MLKVKSQMPPSNEQSILPCTKTWNYKHGYYILQYTLTPLYQNLQLHILATSKMLTPSSLWLPDLGILVMRKQYHILSLAPFYLQASKAMLIPSHITSLQPPVLLLAFLRTPVITLGPPG